MTQRELDTFAHQLHLMRLAGYKVTDAEFTRYSAKLMTWMADWWHIPGETDEDRAVWCAQEISHRYEKLTAPEVTDKLEAWLDKTHKRLRLADSRSRRAIHPVRARFTGQGVAYH
jgi:Leu/Phe-tRNA-protein transferase